MRGPMMVMDPQYAKQIDVWIAFCYGQLGNREKQRTGTPPGVDRRSLVWPGRGRWPNCSDDRATSMSP